MDTVVGKAEPISVVCKGVNDYGGGEGVAGKLSRSVSAYWGLEIKASDYGDAARLRGCPLAIQKNAEASEGSMRRRAFGGRRDVEKERIQKWNTQRAPRHVVFGRLEA